MLGPRKPRGAEDSMLEGLLHLSGTILWEELTETRGHWLSLGRYVGTQHLPGSCLSWSTPGMKEKAFATD